MAFPFSTVLVANRGEIAVRIMRTQRGLELRSVAVYSDADAGARHVVEAYEALRIGPGPALASYLDAEALLCAAARSGAEAVHPSYGFLSEDAAFARACVDAGLVFIGLPPEAVELMGDKIRANPNAVQLGARSPCNTGPRWAGWLWPRLVPLPLHVPLDVLAFDHPRVAAMATGRIEPPCQQPDGIAPTVVSGLRGKHRAPLGSSGERCGVRRRS